MSGTGYCGQARDSEDRDETKSREVEDSSLLEDMRQIMKDLKEHLQIINELELD